MISLDKVVIGTPILLTKGYYFYQPTIREIVEMEEQVYWGALNIWTLGRKDLLTGENEITNTKSDFEIWADYMCHVKQAQDILIKSCLILLHTKVDFLPTTNTIIIGEETNKLMIDESFYLLMKALCLKLFPDSTKKDEQYKEGDNMSDREKQMIAKMKARQKTLDTINGKEDDKINSFGKRIVGLVAIGHYTFEQVYNLTMLQFNLLLQKYIEIQGFELTTMLSPYMDSKKQTKANDFWLDT